MPRPGPRPYECVRRAWHSDRHQPIRGSIISQILRVVTEAHSAATRKNREWQEKLPTVVFKAEEILYSKANSEAEYLDPVTLWDRLNDAIDTIIRKEEVVETADYLQPCIEAALVLGCVPVKASRSQRLCNPRTYLQPRAQEPAPRAFGRSDEPVNERQPLNHTLVPPSNQFIRARPPVGSQLSAAPILDNRTTQSGTHVPPNNASCLRPNIERDAMPARATESNQVMRMSSTYPLCYGTDHQNLNSCPGIHLSPNQNPGNVIIGRPIGWSSARPAHHRTTRELFRGLGGGVASDNPVQGNQANPSRASNVLGCDLSLRLGRTSDPPTNEMRIQCRYEAGSSGRCQDDGRDTPSSSRHPGICFFPRQNPNDLLEPCSSRRPFENEGRDVSTSLRKRKMPFANDADDGSLRRQPEQRPNHFPGPN